MKFSHFTQTDINQLVKIHKNSFTKEHFTSYFPENLLRKYFTKLIEFNDLNVGAYADNGGIKGFILAGNRFEVSIKRFKTENRLAILLQLLLHPNFLFEKLLEFFFQIAGKKFISKEKIRVYLFEIDREYQGRGLGKELLNSFENFLMTREIFSYGLSVRIKNKRAVNFYRQNGFIEEFSNYKSIYFIKRLSEINK